MSGRGVPLDYKKGMELYLLAAEHGNPHAIKFIALGYKRGLGLPQDDEKAAAWGAKAASLAGADADVVFLDSMQSKETELQGEEEIFAEFLRQANQGNARGFFYVSVAYTSGTGVARNYIKAEKWAREAAELGLTYHNSAESLVAVCDVINISCPLHPETEHLFNDELISKCKPGAYIINTARGKICDKDAIAEALKSGQLSGYAGDVWFPQPAPNDHVWRTMPHHGMTPHTSGTSLSAQTRYADGVREILECLFDGEEIRNEYLIVQGGDLAGMGAHSYTKGTATGGSEEAAKFKK